MTRAIFTRLPSGRRHVDSGQPVKECAISPPGQAEGRLEDPSRPQRQQRIRVARRAHAARGRGGPCAQAVRGGLLLFSVRKRAAPHWSTTRRQWEAAAAVPRNRDWSSYDWVPKSTKSPSVCSLGACGRCRRNKRDVWRATGHAHRVRRERPPRTPVQQLLLSHRRRHRRDAVRPPPPRQRRSCRCRRGTSRPARRQRLGARLRPARPRFAPLRAVGLRAARRQGARRLAATWRVAAGSGGGRRRRGGNAAATRQVAAGGGGDAAA